MLKPLRQQHELRITMGRVVMMLHDEDDDEGTEGGMQKERRFTIMGWFRSCLGTVCLRGWWLFSSNPYLCYCYKALCVKTIPSSLNFGMTHPDWAMWGWTFQTRVPCPWCKVHDCSDCILGIRGVSRRVWRGSKRRSRWRVMQQRLSR